jgi:hypothetical protein
MECQGHVPTGTAATAKGTAFTARHEAGQGLTAGLLHCVRKDGARHSFRDSCYRMANTALCSCSYISQLFIRFAGVAAIKGDAL